MEQLTKSQQIALQRLLRDPELTDALQAACELERASWLDRACEAALSPAVNVFEVVQCSSRAKELSELLNALIRLASRESQG